MTAVSRLRPRWRTVAVDVALVGAVLAWGVGAWLTHGVSGGRTASPELVGRAAASADPFGAFDPIAPHRVLDCGLSLQPLLRSLRALQHSVEEHGDRAEYDTLLLIEQVAYSRSNFGALDGRCAALVATPAAAASDLYVRADSVWSGCDPGHCTGPGPSTLLPGLWAKASRDVNRAVRGRDAVERPWVSLDRAR